MIEFKYGDLEFQGLPLDKYENLPWSNKKEKTKFFEDLIEKNTPVAKNKVKLFLRKESEEKIHISLSKSIVFIAVAVLITLFSVFSTTILTSLIAGVFALSFLTLGIINRFKAKNEFQSIGITEMMVDLLFDFDNE